MITGKFYTRSGDLIFIRNVDDFVALVEREISDEAGGMVRELANQADEVQQRLQSDLNSYESQLDSQAAVFREIQSQNEKLLKFVQSTPIAASTRNQLLPRLKAIEKLSNQL